YEFQESEEEVEAEELQEPEEEFEEVQEDADDSQVKFLTTEGVDDDDEYDEVFANMNINSYVVMIREQLNKKKDV
ncbi:hypothetical protein KI387_032424, partial [Taxus chinensis]